MSKIRCWIYPAMLLLGACTKVPEPASAVVSGPSASESRALCLAPVAGNTPMDIELRRLQAKVGQAPDRAELWAAVGREWVRKARWSSDPGFYFNVDGCANEALATKPGFIPAQELRSLVLMNDHLFEQARALAQNIRERAPDSVVAHGVLSDALLEMGRYPEAAQALQAQMQAHPGMAAYARAAHLNWLKGDSRSAKLFFRDALMERHAGDPESAAWVFVEAGMIYWHQGDYAGADAIFSEALRWLPGYPPARVGRGRAALAEGRVAAAIEHLEKAQNSDPQLDTAWLLGDAHALAGDGRRARLSYQDAERQGRRGDKLALAYFLASKNRGTGEALRLLAEERQHRGGRACGADARSDRPLACGGIYVDDAYAWALYRAGRLQDARLASGRALRLGTQDARLLYHAGAIELAAGDRVRGRRLLAQALALNPAFDLNEAAQARTLLALSARSLARN